MKRSRKWQAVALAAVLGVFGLGASAPPALGADGFSIGISGPSSATVGQPLVLKVSGKNPTPGYPDYYWYGTWMSVDVISTNVVPSCPPGHQEGAELGVASAGFGGGYLTLSMKENVDANGNWSNTVGYTPAVAGTFVICAYSDDGYTNTLARASLPVTIQAAGAVAGPKKCKKLRKRAARKRCRKRS